MYIKYDSEPQRYKLVMSVILVVIIAYVFEVHDYTNIYPELRLLGIGLLHGLLIWANSIHRYYIKHYYLHRVIPLHIPVCRIALVVLMFVEFILFIDSTV
jgi:hypothetical protein